MQTQQLKTYKQLLLKLQLDLKQEEQDGKEAAEPVSLDQSKVGRLSRVDALQNQALSLETQRRRAYQLEQIKLALKRLEEDEFGCCLDCGDVLDEKRLAINPAAALCVNCAQKREN